MLEYSMTTVVVMEAVLMAVSLWGFVLFPLLCHFLRQRRQIPHEMEGLGHEGELPLLWNTCDRFFSTLSVYAATALGVSFVPH
jgi:hypothetical protein